MIETAKTKGFWIAAAVWLLPAGLFANTTPEAILQEGERSFSALGEAGTADAGQAPAVEAAERTGDPSLQPGGHDGSWRNDFLDLPPLTNLSASGVELQILADVFLSGHRERVYGSENLADIIERDRLARNAPRGFLEEIRSFLSPRPSGLLTEIARMNFRGKLDLQILSVLLARKALENGGEVDSSEAVVIWSVLVKVAQGRHGEPLYGSLGDDRGWTQYMKAAIDALDKGGYLQVKRSWGFAGDIKSVKPSDRLSQAIEERA